MKKTVAGILIGSFMAGALYASPLTFIRELQQSKDNTSGEVADTIIIKDANSRITSTTVSDAIDELATTIATKSSVSIPVGDVRIGSASFGTVAGAATIPTATFSDGAMVLSYAAGASATVAFSFALPANFDPTQDLVVTVRAKCATETPTLSLLTFLGTDNSTYISDASSALSSTYANKEITVAAADIAAAGRILNFKLVVGSHATGVARIKAIEIKYGVTL